MASIVPSWMDIQFFERALKEDSKQIKVLNFDAHSPMGPGDNFTSKILRVQVNYLVGDSQEKKTVTLIVKEPIGEGFFGELCDKANFYGKEPEVYSKLLPFIFKKFKQHLAPKGYISPIKEVMVMQDLKAEGFVVTKGTKQLDYIHCETVMQIIAKFHACSLPCFKQNSHLKETIGKENLWVKGTVYEKWVQKGAKIILDVAKEINSDQRFVNFLASKLETIFEEVEKVHQPKQTGINVLNHGDLWMSNFMFKYDGEGNILDGKLIDFQMSKWASPAADLTYFVWTSGNEDVRRNRLTDLFRVYMNTFNHTLEQIGSTERLTWEELYTDLQTARVWGLALICLSIPLMIQAPEDVVDFINFTEEDLDSERLKNSYRSKTLLSFLPQFSQHYSNFYLSST